MSSPLSPIVSVPKSFEGGVFVREPLLHVASPGLGTGHRTLAGLVPHVRERSGGPPEDLRHVLKGVSRPRGAVYPIASLPRSPRSVHPVIAAAHGPRWRARGVKLWDVGGQVHRGQDLLGDVLGLDECDEAERGLALRAEELKPESFPQQLRLS